MELAARARRSPLFGVQRDREGVRGAVEALLAAAERGDFGVSL